LELSGVLECVRVAAWREEDPRQRASELRLRYGSAPVVAEVNQEICQVLIGLGTPVMVVHSENYEKGGPGTIPNIEVPP
jgi:hypothetical protein